MKALVVRVHKASVTAEDKVISSITRGLVVFVGIEKDDSDAAQTEMAEKIINLRIFEDERGKLHYSLKDKGLPLLCVSNFTLCADTGRGRRPSFDTAMPAAQADKAFEKLVTLLADKGIKIEQGSFGQHMDINIEMDGPVNIWLDSQ